MGALPLVMDVLAGTDSVCPDRLSNAGFWCGLQGMVLIKMLGAAAAQIAGKLNILVTVALSQPQDPVRFTTRTRAIN